MGKYFKGCLMVFLAVVVILIVSVAGLLAWFRYSSPVLEAGREYMREVRSYRGADDVQSMDDVYQRLEVLDSHYGSVTFDKMQGGDRTEVTLSDIQTLFGEPHETWEDLDIMFASKAHFYHYDDQTLGFYEDYSGIDEYVLETYNDELYDSAVLDELFVEFLNNGQDHSGEIHEDELDIITGDAVPTRFISQNGWFDWNTHPRYYFDDGTGDYAPEEHLALYYHSRRDRANEVPTLAYMERRYSEPFQRSDSPADVERMQAVKYELLDQFEEDESYTIKVGELNETFGDLAKISYNFRDGTLALSWLIMKESPMREIIGTVSSEELEGLELNALTDLAELDVSEFKDDQLLESDIPQDDFIGR